MNRQEAIDKLVEHGMSLERTIEVTDDAIETDIKKNGGKSLSPFVNFMIEHILPMASIEYKRGSSRMKEIEKSFNENRNKRW